LSTELLHIIAGCKTRNRDAQKDLYFLTIARMKSVLSRYCNDVNDAKDIVQSTYLVIYEKIHQFDAQKGDFNAWSNRILINEYFQLLRKRKKTIDLQEGLLDDNDQHQFDWSRFTLLEVKQVIGNMNESHALLLNLYFFEQYEYKELAELLNLKESSVRGNLSRAKKAFDIQWAIFSKTSKILI
jgi:RNA polymerase sigma factor (sigma-70 family)